MKPDINSAKPDVIEKVYDNMLKSYLHLINKDVVNNVTNPSFKVPNNPIAFANFYNFPTQQNALNKPKIGVVSFGGSYFTADLEFYWKNILQLTTWPTVNYVNVGGATTVPNKNVLVDEGSSIENTMDIQIIGAICPNSTITVYFAPNNLNCMSTVLEAALANNDIVSVSWGASEFVYGQTLINKINATISKYASKIICVASGDNGCSNGDSYYTPNADFPSTCPYVTSCGGTTVNLATKSEITWSWNKNYQWGGGGSPSAYVNEPSFQTKVKNFIYPKNVKTYFALQTRINNKRKVPDIALNADPNTGWDLYFNGKVIRTGGTSASAPCMAGFFGLCNLKFTTNVNNLLYHIYYNVDRSVFKDITYGSNNNINVPYFFDARADYDLCTGLGSFDGTKLYDKLKIYSIQ